ncbi:two-partner secretion domain-containing protein [Leptothoe spongobia]|uniref:Filamentous hemagglutinin N-terminal domain-containing protein n=1 Tax=Leptothoe spongobia TAU-MAC 1115 TaxID=1967444 RepID=A0A947DD86_9CYAN|nr:filamentous hemagglutinin N-terminal domain-containing protein [Leptothoe spongobia]MBT9314837.1 filamentous hemagglutinin N-terminal domain-containing protein [Leptothoe spongobia TAU-MAC 1115]
MTHIQCVRWFQLGLVLFISHIATVVQAAPLGDEVFIAQIIPDDTLGPESSIFTNGNDSDVIHGGAIRGANLFHSFQDFNINTGQQVYFLNPEGIETILSRITGNNVSNIDGLLGVDGTADLFLLNPNGITFGPNAQLDILGAFTASTADTLEFTDGSVFSAVNPQGASFLTMSVPLGVQFGALPQGDITSTGVLGTGEDLTLSSNQLYLEGQLIAGDDLTLQAQDTVTIRDTATDAFMAWSGDELTIQGNQGIDIWTLQHLEQTPFVSGGDLALISDGMISGDAHFESGGSLQFLSLEGLPGNFVSLYDPIIFADGDVVFGDYQGAALKVEATGSIQAGNIKITGPDTSGDLMADGSGSDEDLLASSRATILRAGVDSTNTPNIPQTAGEIPTLFSEGVIADQPSGSIVVSDINTSDPDGGDGGPIILNATGNIVIMRDLNSSSGNRELMTGSGTGGAITVFSELGSITINGTVFSGSDSGNNGGDIVISSETSDITIGGNVSSNSLSFLRDGGNGGDIKISSDASGITIGGGLSSGSFSESGDAGNSGSIDIFSGAGGITIDGGIFSASAAESSSDTPNNGGAIYLSSESGDIEINGGVESNSFAASGAAGNGGAISISSGSGNITTSAALNSSSSTNTGTAGDGGAISISSGSGNITTFGSTITNESLNSTSRSFSALGTARNGGKISISSSSGDITVNRRLNSFSSSPGSGTAGNGGAISISSDSGNISTNERLSSFSFSDSGTAGNGGDISLLAKDGVIIGNNNAQINALSIVREGGITGAGGTISLEAQEISNLEVLTISSAGQSGNVEIDSSTDSLTISNLNLITSGQVITSNPFEEPSILGDETITLVLSDFGQAGKTTITSDGNLTLNAVKILSDANRAAAAGDLEIISAGDIQLNDSAILSNTNSGSSGNGGNIFITGENSITLNGGRINTNTEGSGRAGSISIMTPLLNIQNGARVTAETSSPVNEGIGGTITIGADEINLADSETIVSVSTSGPASAGSVILQPKNSGSIEINTLGEGPQISASTGTGSRGTGGNITIRDAVVAKLDNTELVTSGNGSGSAGSIFVENVDVLLMRRGSLILAEASDTGGGGNVVIDAGFVFTIPEEDNDILANASFGQGGMIDITANLIVGFRKVEQFSPTLRGNRISDINASSEFDVDGTIRLDTDPASELTELPTDLIDPANRIAQGCRAEDFTINDGPPGDFIITGRGGQLLAPSDIVSEDAPLDDLGPDIVQPESLMPDTESSLPLNQQPVPLADSQTAIVTESGEVFLIADGAWQPSVSCTALSQPS